MRRSRSALPLPRYTLHKRVKNGWSYFFNIPSWARERGCPLQNEPLGADYDRAVQRVERILLPAFDSWRSTSGISFGSEVIYLRTRLMFDGQTAYTQMSKHNIMLPSCIPYNYSFSINALFGRTN